MHHFVNVVRIRPPWPRSAATTVNVPRFVEQNHHKQDLQDGTMAVVEYGVQLM